MMNNRKLLIVADSFHGPNSGAAVARDCARRFELLGSEVRYFKIRGGSVSAEDLQGMKMYDTAPFQMQYNFFGGKFISDFEAALDDFKPDSVMFIGGTIDKPAAMYTACEKRGIPTMCHWLQQDFYCAQGYGVLPTGPCDLCVNGNYKPSFEHRCTRYPGLKGSAMLVAQAQARKRVLSHINAIEAQLASTEDQFDRLRKNGAKPKAFVKTPLWFDPKRIEGFESHKGDYFVFFSVPHFGKGPQYIEKIARATKQKIVVLGRKGADPEKEAREYGIHDLLGDGRVVLRTDLSFLTGAAQVVADSLGVINPSIWPTTTEYTLLESTGMGKPVFAFDVAANGELIVDGENGFKAPLHDHMAIVERMELLATTPGLYEKVSANALAFYREHTADSEYERVIHESWAAVGKPLN